MSKSKMTPEIKALIEKEALELWPTHLFPSGSQRRAYAFGASTYAEKLEAAEQENARINTEHNHLISEWKILKAKKDQFKQENERLRVALEKLTEAVNDLDGQYMHGLNFPKLISVLFATNKIAAEALKPKQ